MFLRLSILSIWSFLDPLYYLCTRLHYVDKSQDTKAIFRVRLTKYKGAQITLSDGTQILKNDTLLKIHLHNVRILKELKGLDNSLQKGKKIYKLVQQSMPLLTQFIMDHQKESDIKGIIGITMINKGVKKLGFETFEPKNYFYKRFKEISQLPIYLLSTPKPTFKKFKDHEPVYLVMSKGQLADKYPLRPKV